MLLTKTLALSATELKFNEDTGSFKGYASVWGGIDTYQDTILKGAFIDTLRDDGMPKMFYQHKENSTLLTCPSIVFWYQFMLPVNPKIVSIHVLCI